jgi:hypothetical protein
MHMMCNMFNKRRQHIVYKNLLTLLDLMPFQKLLACKSYRDKYEGLNGTREGTTTRRLALFSGYGIAHLFLTAATRAKLGRIRLWWPTHHV